MKLARRHTHNKCRMPIMKAVTVGNYKAFISFSSSSYSFPTALSPSCFQIGDCSDQGRFSQNHMGDPPFCVRLRHLWPYDWASIIKKYMTIEKPLKLSLVWYIAGFSALIRLEVMIKRINMDFSWIFRCPMVGWFVTRFFNFSTLDFSLDFILNNISIEI